MTTMTTNSDRTCRRKMEADYPEVALTCAHRLATDERGLVQYLEANLCDLHLELEPFDFQFDRSCYGFALICFDCRSTYEASSGKIPSNDNNGRQSWFTSGTQI